MNMKNDWLLWFVWFQLFVMTIFLGMACARLGDMIALLEAAA